MPCVDGPLACPLRQARSIRLHAWRMAMALGLLACFSTAAHAGDCEVNTSPVVFGTYDPITTTSPMTANGNVRVECAPTNIFEVLFGVYVDVALNQGSSGTFAARTMRQPPSSVLQYNLYTSAGYATIWGDGTGGTLTRSYGGGGNAATGTGFGRITTGQYVTPGVYTDTITVTITY